MAAIIFFTFLLALLSTYIIRTVALHKHVIDSPNSRSAHTLATPTAGGLGVVISLLISCWYVSRYTSFHIQHFFPLLYLSLSVALVGFIDDIKNISRRFRFFFQCIVVTLGVYYLLDWQLPVSVSHLFFCAIAIIGLVWFINLFNFMDGINGLACVEAITTLLGGAYLSYLLLGNDNWCFMVILAAASFGFLFWNFPLSRIFLGDTGSCFYGFLLGFLALQQGLHDSRLGIAWVILLAVFIVDSSATLLRRLVNNENFFQAHNTHAYQCAARRLSSHTPVTLAVLLINTCYLFPIALGVVTNTLTPALGLSMAFSPLVFINLYFILSDNLLQKPTK